MSQCIRHEACPECGPIADGAGDNLGVYDDGHKWCFACAHYVGVFGEPSLADMRGRLVKANTGQLTLSLPIVLPADHTYILPAHALIWLRMYGITDEELNQQKVGWSADLQRLILPLYDATGGLLFWQGRYCPTEPVPGEKRHKYINRGQPDVTLAIFGREKVLVPSSICVVEDFFSAIKVGRVMPTLCLWGSELSMTKIRRLALLYSELVIWLDTDKAAYSARCEIKARPYFDRVGAIYTQCDPKTYTTGVITRWIHK